MKLQQIMGETIDGIVVRKNSVVILRPRKQLTGLEHAKYGQQITKWGEKLGVRVTLVPHEFDVMALDDEDGKTLLQNAQAELLRGEIAMLTQRFENLREVVDDMHREMHPELTPDDDAEAAARSCKELGVTHV